MTPTPPSQTREDSLHNVAGFNILDMPPTTFPPLPPINDKALYNVVTTHASLHLYKKYSMNLHPKIMVEDYEKLEHVGDAILGESSADRNRVLSVIDVVS